jgi:cysteine desulfurase
LIYLDNNASAPISPNVHRAISLALSELHGNPSSTHMLGIKPRNNIEHSRDTIAQWLGTTSENVFFTSGATESNNLVISSVASRCHSPKIVSTTVEHPSVLEPAKHYFSNDSDAHFLSVNTNGLISLDELKKQLISKPDLVSIQWVNNETGIIQPIEKIVDLCNQYETLLHIDAAQAVGKIPIDLSVCQPDFLTFSGHKIHAPAGIGALIAKNKSNLSSLIFGGEQEKGIRSGTENYLGIVGLEAAINDRQKHFNEHYNLMKILRDKLEHEITDKFLNTSIIGNNSERVPNTSNIYFSEIDGQALVAQLTGHDICCSQSSACSNSRPEPSYVLRAMGMTEQEAYSCIRFSVSPLNTLDEINKTVKTISMCINKLLALSGGF